MPVLSPRSKSLLHLPVHTVPFPWNPAAHLHEAVPSGSRRQLPGERASAVCRKPHNTHPLSGGRSSSCPRRNSEVLSQGSGESPLLAWPQAAKTAVIIRKTRVCSCGHGPWGKRVATHLPTLPCASGAALRTLLREPTQYPIAGTSSYYYYPHLQMKKSRLRGIHSLSQGHAVSDKDRG